MERRSCRGRRCRSRWRRCCCLLCSLDAAGGLAGAITRKGVPFTRAVENQILDGKGGDGFTTQGDVFPIHGATMTPGNPGKWKGRSYPTEERTKPSPEWNHYRIECNNGTISL